MSDSRISGKIAEILLVEDNPADAEITKQGFRKGKIANNVHVVEDGEQALAFLRREDPFADSPRPDLILLDLNLPGRDGREVLKEIKADSTLRTIPVVVLTTSDTDSDILRTYQLHANAFMTKPVDFNKFVELVKSIGDYWFTVVMLPPSD